MLDPVTLTAVGCLALLGVPELVSRTWLRDLHQANSSLAEGEWEQAREYYSIFMSRLDARPELKRIARWCGYQLDVDAFVHINLGVCELRLSRPEKAHTHFLQAVSIAPWHPHTHFNLGGTHLALGDPTEGARCLRMADQLGFSDQVGSLERLGRALPWRRGAESKRPAKSGALSLIAYAYGEAGLLVEAVRCHRAAIASGETDGRGGLCICLLRQGLLDEAGLELNRMSAVERDGLNGQLALLAYHSMRGDFEQALHHCDRAAELSPSRAWALATRAETHFVAGQWVEAEALAKEAVQSVEGTSRSAFGVLAQLAVRTKNWEGALEYAVQGLAQGETGYLLEAKAQAHLGLCQPQEAEPALQRFLEYCKVLAPLECDLELRTYTAQKLLLEVQAQNSDL